MSILNDCIIIVAAPPKAQTTTTLKVHAQSFKYDLVLKQAIFTFSPEVPDYPSVPDGET